jgi:alkanesulfonate monooxygenase SsuD/methylene tetrahydromethanopterin reductase-like flavin-dependent oxidoreductase (luciferase family)
MMPIRGSMALYIGGMGARGKNFYNDYAKRLGFEEAAVRIQDLYLEGRKDEAMAAVPAELIDACHLVGPADRIRERLQRWQAAGRQGHVSSMLLGCQQPEALALVAETVL